MTARQELIALVRNKWKQLIKWCSIDTQEKWYINALHLLYKIPVMMLMILVSPIAMIGLIFAFVILI